MMINRRLRFQLAAQGGLLAALLVALVTLLAYFAHEYRKEWDVTLSGRNTLSAGTVEVLMRLDGPLAITAYAVSQDARGVNVQKVVEERLRPYRRAKPDIRLAMIDPREQPKLAASAGIRAPNELVIEYKGRTEHMAAEDFGEQTFANLLMRLARGTDTQILWLEGHGERRLDGRANHELGDFGRQLQQRGFRLNSVNLGVAQDVPANSSALIIASPQVDLMPAEIEKIERWFERGGNLLWLLEPAPLRGLQPIAERLGLVLNPGTVVDFAVTPRTGPPVFALGAAGNYGRHPITELFSLNTLFPHARQIETVDSEEWRVTRLVDVAPRGWVELDRLDREIVFDRTRDIPGPVTVAVAFERTIGERQQRVVVVGSSEFLSNTFIGNGGNLDFGINVVNWLSGAEHLITVEPRPAIDGRLDLDRVMLYLIAIAFLVALPLAFVLAGTMIWWRRRRAAH